MCLILGVPSWSSPKHCSVDYWVGRANSAKEEYAFSAKEAFFEWRHQSCPCIYSLIPWLFSLSSFLSIFVAEIMLPENNKSQPISMMKKTGGKKVINHIFVFFLIPLCHYILPIMISIFFSCFFCLHFLLCIPNPLLDHFLLIVFIDIFFVFFHFFSFPPK